MKGDAKRILTSHVGSLPRPHDLLDMMKARLTGEGEPVDEAAYRDCLGRAVRDVVRRQVDCGVDVVTDGEMSKPGFYAYARERLAGFAPRPGSRDVSFRAEREAFPEYYEEYFARAMYGASLVPSHSLVCVGPIRYTGHEALARDVANLRAAMAAAGAERAFMPATAPSGIGRNEHYATDAEYLEAAADAMGEEYRAIVDAGFDVQIDDPFLSDVFGNPDLDDRERAMMADENVDVLNHALRGIPEERIRFHTCYGINEGPRIHEPQLGDVIGHVYRVNAGVYSFEAANARHQHDYHVFEAHPLPEGKAIMPGLVTHAGNIVEHPELIAEWLVRFANLVGRENVIAGADCGFSSQATYRTEVHPTVVWAKLESLAEGAALASARLWN